MSSQPPTTSDPPKPLDASQPSTLDSPNPRASEVTNEQLDARSASMPLNPQPPVRRSLGEGGSSLNLPSDSSTNPSAFSLHTSALPSDSSLPLYKGETEQAYEAFCTFLSLGPDRNHQKTADLTATKISNIRYWSARFRWKERIELLNARKLQHLLTAQAEVQTAAAIDWAKRSQQQIELQWDSANELVAAARDCLRDFIAHPDNMSLGQIANALETGSKISQLAIDRASANTDSLSQDVSTLRQQLEVSLKKAHPPKTQPEPDPTPSSLPESPPP